MNDFMKGSNSADHKNRRVLTWRNVKEGNCLMIGRFSSYNACGPGLMKLGLSNANTPLHDPSFELCYLDLDLYFTCKRKQIL